MREPKQTIVIFVLLVLTGLLIAITVLLAHVRTLVMEEGFDQRDMLREEITAQLFDVEQSRWNGQCEECVCSEGVPVDRCLQIIDRLGGNPDFYEKSKFFTTCVKDQWDWTVLNECREDLDTTRRELREAIAESGCPQ